MVSQQALWHDRVHAIRRWHGYCADEGSLAGLEERFFLFQAAIAAISRLIPTKATMRLML